MPLLHICLVLVVIGVLLWLVTTYIPLDPTIRKLLIGVVVIVTVLWLLQAFGLLSQLEILHVDRHK